MLSEIQSMREQLVNALKVKGIDYINLRGALVPDHKKLEVALIFDSTACKSETYGHEVFARAIPLLNHESQNSILAGDYIGENEHQKLLHKAFNDEVRPVRKVNFRHSDQFYIVYISNLTKGLTQKLTEGLADYEAYVGFANTTYGSLFKTLLSMMLVNVCVKYKGKIIQGHPDDTDSDENVNMSGYPFEASGYKCISVQQSLKGVFLSYKIERAVLPGFEHDTHFSINSVNSNIQDIYEFNVEVAQEKLDYVKRKNADFMLQAGLNDVTSDEFKIQIRDKIRSNYIYRMSHSDDYKFTKFNVMIEFSGVDGQPLRQLAALKYHPDRKVLELITSF